MGKGRKKARISERILEEEDAEIKGRNEEGFDRSSSSSGNDLYKILGVDRAASQQEIKKAYHKLALRLHPDKNPNYEEAKEKFQQLQKVISILGDEEKRTVYDQTGCVDDEDLAGDVVQNLKTFFRTMYKKISEADIEEFEVNYRGSESEKKDLLELYSKWKGNMDRLFCCMICSDPILDSHRFKDMIDEAISEGDVKQTKAYEKWSKQVSKRKPPTSPLRQSRRKSNESSDLYAIIAQRRIERKGEMDSMLLSFVQKYGGNAAAPEPSEEEFEAAQKRLEKKQTSKRK